jgi:hypothetical protein
LNNGVVHLGFGSHGDNPPYHGWVLGYDARALTQVMAFNVTPNGEGGGIWQSGGGLAADAAGDIYFATGNGTFTQNQGGIDYGDSFIRLSPRGEVLDFFTPHDQATLGSTDTDLGSGGVMLIPDQAGANLRLMIEASKEGTVYLVDTSRMGHYNANNDNQIAQSLTNIFNNNFSSPVYFNGSVFFGPHGATAKAFSLEGGMLSIGPTSGSFESYGFPGAALAVSAHGAANGILWAIQRNGSSAPAVLIAYDAGNLGDTLYSSDEARSRDTLDAAAKFSIPLVANGKVFVGSMSQLTVYGLLP